MQAPTETPPSIPIKPQGPVDAKLPFKARLVQSLLGFIPAEYTQTAKDAWREFQNASGAKSKLYALGSLNTIAGGVSTGLFLGSLFYQEPSLGTFATVAIAGSGILPASGLAAIYLAERLNPAIESLDVKHRGLQMKESREKIVNGAAEKLMQDIGCSPEIAQFITATEYDAVHRLGARNITETREDETQRETQLPLE